MSTTDPVEKDLMSQGNRRSTRLKKKPPDLRCGNQLCNEIIDDNKTEHIKCERCQENFHLSCTGMNVDALKYIINNNCKDSFIKCCLPCQPQARKEIGSIKDLENRIIEVDKKLDKSINNLERNINTKLDSIEKALENVDSKIEQNDTSIKGEIKTMNRTLKDTNIAEIGKKMREITKLEEKITTQVERNDRKWRANNLVFYNIPESDSTSGADRRKDDCEKLKIIFKDKQLSICGDKILNVIRLGVRKDKVRPIKMVFSSLEYKTEVYCKKLRYIKDNLSTPIYHSLDLSKSEQEAKKALVEEINKENKITVS